MGDDLLDELKSGQPRPLKAEFRGVEYPGEVLLVDGWQPELGEIAGKDTHFRIVIFNRYQRVPDIADRRVACCIPGQALKEEGETYRAGRKTTPRKRAATYAQGQICTKERLAFDARDVFKASDMAMAFQTIAGTLISNAYASMPQSEAPLADLASEVVAMKSYLEGVTLRESDGELAMDRVSILEQLSMENLLRNLHVWPSLKALFDWFLSRYRPAYQAHHSYYQREMASLHLVLDDSCPEIDALRRLNSIAELGKPVGQELIEEYQRLLESIKPCPAAEGELPLESEPVCPRCGILLTDEPQQQEVERFLRRLKQGLKQQQQRLSSEAVRQILAQSDERGIDRFVKVVQTSELYPLVRLLDDELVEFLRRLLQEAQVDIQWRPAIAELTEKFPSLEEDDIAAVAAHFADLLQKAFARAKKEHPGKRIRLSFKE